MKLLGICSTQLHKLRVRLTVSSLGNFVAMRVDWRVFSIYSWFEEMTSCCDQVPCYFWSSTCQNKKLRRMLTLSQSCLRGIIAAAEQGMVNFAYIRPVLRDLLQDSTPSVILWFLIFDHSCFCKGSPFYLSSRNFNQPLTGLCVLLRIAHIRTFVVRTKWGMGHSIYSDSRACSRSCFQCLCYDSAAILYRSPTYHVRSTHVGGWTTWILVICNMVDLCSILAWS